MGRSDKALKNVMIGLGNKILMLALAFLTRTVFIRLLGAEYTGISSLYTNILSVLSLAELGLGNVLMFYLYSALKDNDKERINQLVFEFKNIYRLIIVCVLGVGVVLIPFLNIIVKSTLDQRELIVYFLLYLINSVASYFVVYRTLVISADQKNYILDIVQSLMTVVMYILQIGYLLLFCNFIGYLIIQVLCTIVQNLITNYIAVKKYPFLRSKRIVNKKIINKAELVKSIKATFLFKVSDTILDQTDNIIISIMFGTVFVGYYTNYFMLISYIVAIAGIIANGLLASFGNLNAEGDMKKSYKMFKTSMLGFAVIGTYCVGCYACVVQDFISIWVGKQYLMEYSLVLAILAVFYLRMVTNTIWIYRSSMGLFKEVQYINIIAAILNIFLSIILGKTIGMPGVIVATAISRLLTSFWYEGKVVFDRFEKKVQIYYWQQIKDLGICVFTVYSSYKICEMVNLQGITAIVIKVFIVTIVTFGIEFLVYHKSQEFQIIIRKIKGRNIKY